ncbi:MAG: dehydrogenase [Armatimonadota bacterium]|nr:MAG: dehydrogenase [Armatimonadota bacterium]
MLRVGIVGVGTMGRTHASAYMKLPNTQLVGFTDAISDAARRVASQFGVQAFDNYEAMLEQVDMVDICTPTPTHLELVLGAASAGKHILCEKPLGRTLQQCEQMIEAADKAGVTLMPAQVLRFFPEFKQARDLVLAGAIGKPAAIRTRRGGPYPRAANDWYADFEQSGGPILDMVIHDFDWLRWTFGEVERVFAKSLTFKKLDHIDYALITLRLKSGAIAHVEANWADPGGFKVDFEIAGDAGMIAFDSRFAMPLTVAKQDAGGGGGGVAVPESPLAEDPYMLEIKHFVDSVQAGQQPSITAEDGMKAVEIALAAIESARTGKVIRLGGGA